MTPKRPPGKSQPPPSKKRSAAVRRPTIAERRSVAGWERLPGKAKRYHNPDTGEILSNRQYRQRFLYAGQSLEKVQGTRGAPRKSYNRLLRARQDYLAERGIKANLNEIRQSAAMKDIVRDLKGHRPGFLTPAQRRKLSPAARATYRQMYGPNSDLARALADLGYRDHDARHFVGDS